MLLHDLFPKLLCRLARRFSHTELAQTSEMKKAKSVGEEPNHRVLSTYRAGQAQKVLGAAERYGVGLTGKDVLDLGCNDGSITAQYLQVRPRSLTGVDIDEE